MATPPTRVASVVPASGNYTTTTTPKTSAALPALLVGDVIVVIAGSEQAGTNATVTPTASAGSVTWTLQTSQMAGTTNQSGEKLWTGVVGAGAAAGATISLARINTGTALWWGFSATVWRDHGGVGQSWAGSSGTSNSIAQLTTPSLAANSAIQVGINDWNASTIASPSWQVINGSAMTTGLNVTGASHATAIGGYRTDVGAAGTEVVGLTTPATLRWVMVGVEILGAAAGGTTQAAAGTVPATTATTAAALARLGAAGTLAATTVAVASASVLLGAAGVAAASSNTAGAATVVRPAAGTVAATTDTTGAAERAGQSYSAAGTVAGTSAATGSAFVRLPARGSAGATSDTTAAAVTRLGASGTAAASASSTGAASVVGGPVAHPAAGTVAATSTTSGAAGVRATAAGTAPSVTTTTGAGLALYRVGGLVAATSAVVGAADVVLDPDSLPDVVIGPPLPARFTAAPALPEPVVTAATPRFLSGDPQPPRFTRRP